jgi:formimidoylglutamase
MKNTPEEFKHAGIQTFMKAPYVDITELEDADIAVLGVPLDYGASYRQGAKDGPRGIREYSYWDRVDGTEYVNLSNEEVHKSNSLKIVDLGDIHINPTNPGQTNKEIISTVRRIRRQAFPLILGGDHSITYASFIGCKKGLKKDKYPLGLLHFDAHPDVEASYLTMPRVWHGNPFSSLIHEGHLDGENMITIGPRGMLNKKWFDFINEKKITMYSAPEVKKEGMEEVITKAIKHLKDRCAAVYISLDIDCIDPSEAPGTGTPSVGGLSGADMVASMRKLHQLPVVGFDIVEVAPSLDATGRTMILANDLLWNFLSFGFNKNI